MKRSATVAAPPRIQTIRTALTPAERLLRSHGLVEQAAFELHDGGPASGVKALSFAAATHLALTIGPEAAKAFFQMLAGVAGQVRPKEPGAEA